MYNFSGKGSQRGRFCLALICTEFFFCNEAPNRTVPIGYAGANVLVAPVRIHLHPKMKAPVRTPWFVGEDGFEPPKSKDSRFTVCPIWPLWNSPGLKPVRQLLAGKTGDILLDLLTLV